MYRRKFGATAGTGMKEGSSYVVFGHRAAHFITIFQKLRYKVRPEYHPERTVRLRPFVLNAQGSLLISLGTQIRKARDVGE